MQANYPKVEIIKDIGSELNYKHKGLKSLLGRAMQGDKLEIVVAHKDRLARFFFSLISFLIQQNGGRVVVLKQTNLSPSPGLTIDLLSIRNKFSCFILGLRNYKKQVQRALSKPETNANME